MKVRRLARRAAYGILLFSAQCSSVWAAQPGIVNNRPAGIVHQYPLTGSREVPPGTDIGIRAIGMYDAAALAKQSFVAIGSVSGIHALTAHLSRDRTMAIFHAATPFAYGEEVRFVLSAMLAGGLAITDSIRFTTMIRPAPATIPDWIRNEIPAQGRPSALPLSKGMVHSLGEDDSLPEMAVTVDDRAEPGTIYFDNFAYIQGSGELFNGCYNITTDEHGSIVRDEAFPGASTRDFKLQPNGVLTYLDANYNIFYGMDSNWNIIDTFAAVNYPTDQHELRVFPDGRYALLGLSMSYIDLSDSVPDGYDSALVFGDVIQVFDADGNLMFQWRGIDHYNIADSKYENLTASEIDFEHANSLDFDSSGNIILSNRHLCEISKINGVTGDFMWRLGGAHNQFTIVGDSLCFSFQHDARWIPNGDMTFFDNSVYDTVFGGNGKWVQQSRAVEYNIDTSSMTATLVWQYHHTPETFSDAMGSVERLPNGNTFIGWGDDTSLSMTEVRPDNTTAFEMTMLNGNVSYRAVKFLPDSTSGTAQVAPGSSVAGATLTINAAASGALSALYSLDKSQFVTLAIYDMTGREVRDVLPSQLEASGNHEIGLDLSDLPNAAYECVLTTENNTMVRNFCYLK